MRIREVTLAQLEAAARERPTRVLREWVRIGPSGRWRDVCMRELDRRAGL